MKVILLGVLIVLTVTFVCMRGKAIQDFVDRFTKDKE